MKIRTLSLIISIILMFSNISKAVDIYYDINFSSPEHTVGQTPAVGNQPTRPSSIFGSPIVENSFGAMTEQPLVFNTASNSYPFYDEQIHLNIEKNQTNYFVSFDLLTESLKGSLNHFAVIFDAPSVIGVVDFMNDGRITLNGPQAPTMGTFSDNTMMHTEISINLINHYWSIYINNSPLYAGAFLTNNDLQSIRFSLGLVTFGHSADATTSIGLDNIIVSNVVPEPATILLFGLGILAFRRANPANPP